jgi:hypothetical protein
VAEANELIPELQKLVLKLHALLSRVREEYDLEAERVFFASLGNGNRPVPEPSPLSEPIHKTVDSLHAYGVLLKDVERGLIDFPHVRDGREVFLCWQLGEERIEYWHEIESGYAGRKRLEEE